LSRISWIVKELARRTLGEILGKVGADIVLVLVLARDIVAVLVREVVVVLALTVTDDEEVEVREDRVGVIFPFPIV
jgi:hypothetical protein